MRNSCDDMSETEYNPIDPPFLISKALDEELGPQERQRLDRALAESELLRIEAEQIRVVDRLFKRWGSEELQIDSDLYLDNVTAAIESLGDEAAFGRIDRWLKRWADHPADVDSEQFTAEVMTRVAPNSGRRLWRSTVFRLGAPLAAAAAVMFAVTALFWSNPVDQAVCIVQIRPHDRVRDTTASTDEIETVVAFARSSASTRPQVAVASGVSFVSFGVAEESMGAEEIPPI